MHAGHTRESPTFADVAMMLGGPALCDFAERYRVSVTTAVSGSAYCVPVTTKDSGTLAGHDGTSRFEIARASFKARLNVPSGVVALISRFPAASGSSTGPSLLF